MGVSVVDTDSHSCVEHCRNALVHAVAAMMSVASDVPDGFNVAKAMRSSRLLTNMTAWLVSSKAGAAVVARFYDGDRHVHDEALPAVLALLVVATKVSAMPNWTHAAVEAGDLDAACDDFVTSVLRIDKASLVEPFRRKARQAIDDMLRAMRAIQDMPAAGDSAYAPLGPYEADLLRGLRDAATAMLRLLLVSAPALMGETRAALRGFVDNCTRVRETMDAAVENEPLAARLAVKVQEIVQRCDERMGRLEDEADKAKTRVDKLVVGFSGLRGQVASAQAAALAAEQAAETATRAFKEAQQRKFKSASSPAGLKAVNDALARVDDRVDDLHVAVDKLTAASAAARSTADLADALACLAMRVERLEASSTTASPASSTASPPHTPPHTPVVAALDVLAAAEYRAEVAERRVADAERRLERAEEHVRWLVKVAQRQFINRWNAVHGEWHAMLTDAPADLALPVITHVHVPAPAPR